jgi:hypothetical protein
MVANRAISFFQNIFGGAAIKHKLRFGTIAWANCAFGMQARPRKAPKPREFNRLSIKIDKA